MTRDRLPATCARPASTVPPPFRIASTPGPIRTTSSKTTRTSVVARTSTAPFPGTVLTSVACAQAEPADPSADSRATTRIHFFTSGDIAAFVGSVGDVLFKQFIDDDLGCGSYIVGDEHAGVAVVVDPAYAIERYLDECKRRGVRLVGVLEAHTHADHVSGHGRLALEHGLPVHIHAAAEAAFPHEALGTDIVL